MALPRSIALEKNLAFRHMTGRSLPSWDLCLPYIPHRKSAWIGRPKKSPQQYGEPRNYGFNSPIQKTQSRARTLSPPNRERKKERRKKKKPRTVLGLRLRCSVMLYVTLHCGRPLGTLETRRASSTTTITRFWPRSVATCGLLHGRIPVSGISKKKLHK